MGNYNPKLKREEWRSRVISRTVTRYPGTSDPNPGLNARNASMSMPMARPSAASLAKARREARLRRDATLLLGVACSLILCIAIASVAVKAAQSFFPAGLHSPTAQPTHPSSGAGVATPPASKVRILLLGSDQRPNDAGYRTDTIILVEIDPVKMTVNAVSFPRDLWVEAPGYGGGMKINSVHQIGGFDAITTVFQANFGIRPDYYVMTNFNGFIQFINSRGGVDVVVGKELSDACNLPQSRNGICMVTPGTVTMDGATALWYVRSRESSSDFDRLRRAQEVLEAVVKKMVNIGNVTKLNEIKSQLEDNVQTNLSVEKAVSLLPVAVRVLQSPELIHKYVVGEDQTYPSWSWNGQWILLPDPTAIHTVLQQAGMVP